MPILLNFSFIFATEIVPHNNLKLCIMSDVQINSVNFKVKVYLVCQAPSMVPLAVFANKDDALECAEECNVYREVELDSGQKIVKNPFKVISFTVR